MKTVLKSLTFAIALGLAAANTAQGRRGGLVEDRHRGRGARQHHPARARGQRHHRRRTGSSSARTPVVRKAITAGEIDIYPEYTGNAAFFFNKADDPVWKDAAKGYETAKKLDYDANKIVWLTPRPANNTWAIAVRKDVADANKLKTLSDFGKWVAGGGKVVLAASAEFVNSAAALPAFQTDLRLHAEARAADRALRRRHGGHHQGRRRPDQRRQCRHGLRHRRRHRALGPRGAGGRQGRAAGLCSRRRSSARPC